MLKMPFGKHKDEYIATLPRDYLKWLWENCKLTGELRATVASNIGIVDPGEPPSITETLCDNDPHRSRQLSGLLGSANSKRKKGYSVQDAYGEFCRAIRGEYKHRGKWKSLPKNPYAALDTPAIRSFVWERLNDLAGDDVMPKHASEIL